MCGRSYRPRPDNGSGDSPRPPFLSEFVNHIGKLALVEVVYHLFGGALRPGVHPHVQRPIRLKTESACGIVKLQTAHSEVCENAVSPQPSALSQISKGTLPQLDHRPIRSLAFGFAEVRRPRSDVRLQPPARNLQRRRILIDPN